MAAADALPSGSILWFVDSTAPFIASDGAHLLVPDPICCGQPWQISLLSYTPDAADRRRAVQLSVLPTDPDRRARIDAKLVAAAPHVDDHLASDDGSGEGLRTCLHVDELERFMRDGVMEVAIAIQVLAPSPAAVEPPLATADDAVEPPLATADVAESDAPRPSKADERRAPGAAETDAPPPRPDAEARAPRAAVAEAPSSPDERDAPPSEGGGGAREHGRDELARLRAARERLELEAARLARSQLAPPPPEPAPAPVVLLRAPPRVRVAPPLAYYPLVLRPPRAFVQPTPHRIVTLPPQMPARVSPVYLPVGWYTSQPATGTVLRRVY